MDTQYTAIVALGLTIIGAVWSQGIWISKQFATLKDFVNSKVDGVMDKLEYHERHDDQRFSNINEGLWTIRLDNAQNQRLSASLAKNKDRNVRREAFPPDESGS